MIYTKIGQLKHMHDLNPSYYDQSLYPIHNRLFFGCFSALSGRQWSGSAMFKGIGDFARSLVSARCTFSHPDKMHGHVIVRSN